MANEPPDTGKQLPTPPPVAETNKQPTEQTRTVSVVPAAPPPPPPPPGTSWVLAKEMPYALTIVLAALSWCVLRAIDTIEDSPSIEYVKTVESQSQRNGAFDVTFRVSNISLKHLFRGVSFYIHAPDGGLSKPHAIPLPPSKTVEADNAEPKPESENVETGGTRVKTYKFYVAQLQPGSSWEFKALLSNTSKPDPQLLVDFSPIGTNPEAKTEPVSIRLIRQGLETCLVKHKVKILFFASVFWFIVMVVYLLSIRKKLI